MGFSFNDIFRKVIDEEKSLKEKDNLEEKLKNLKENIYYSQKMLNVGSWTHSLDTNETFLSDGIYNIFEADYKELKDSFESMNTFFHPEDKEKVVKHVKSLFEGVPYEIDYRIVTKTGGTKFLHEKTSTIYDKNGELIKIIGVLEDVQENQNISDKNKSHEEEKSRIQKRLQNRVQVARDGYEIINTDGKITYASPAVERIVGYTYEDLVGKKIYSFFGSSEARLMEDMVKRVTINPIKNVKSEILFTAKDGKEKHLEIYLTKLEDSPLGDIAVNFIDITKRKKLESEIFYQSNYDALTGLKKRDCFLGNLSKIYRKAKKRGRSML